MSTVSAELRQLDRYLLFGLRRINGWLLPYTAEFIAAIADVQRRAGFRGSVGEIGVHHGKLFTLLRLATDRDDPAFVIDVFENQALNIDHSGRGDKDVLRNNLVRWSGSAEGITLISKTSLEVEPEEILVPCGKVRLASIDGGHTAECVYNDLKLMDAVLHDYGVIALDDYFNEDWPDVSNGTARYMYEKDTRLRPFAVAPGKLFLTTAAFNEFYRTKLVSETPFRSAKSSEMFGMKVDIYHGPRTMPPIGTYIREALKASAVGPYLLMAKRGLSAKQFAGR
jgi:hypothetical protein